jgi:O-antigen/teichoic acid export membrane protein
VADPQERTVLREFARGTGVAFTLHLAAAGIAFLTQLLYARLLSPEQYGSLSVALAAVIVTSQVVLLGTPLANLQLIPIYRASRQWGLLRGWMRWALAQSMAAAMAVVVVGVALWSQLSAMPGVGPEWFPALLLLIPVCFIGVLQSQARAFKHIFLAKFPSEVMRPALAAITAVAVYSQVSLTATHVMWCTVGAACLVALVYLWGNRGLLAQAHRQIRRRWAIRHWVQTSGQFLGHSVFHVLLERGDLVVVGWMLGPKAAGVFAIATALGKLLLFALSPVNAMTAPMMSGLYAEGRLPEMRRVLRAGVAAAGTLAIVVSIPMFARPDLALGLFGEHYGSGVRVLQIIALGNLTNALCGSAGLLVNMAEKQHIAWRVVGLAALLNLILLVWWIPIWGLEGAAAARAVSMAAWNITLATYARSTIGVDPSVLSIATWLGSRRKSSDG